MIDVGRLLGHRRWFDIYWRSVDSMQKIIFTKLTYVNFLKQCVLRMILKISANRSNKTDITAVKINSNVHCILAAEGNGTCDKLHKVVQCQAPDHQSCVSWDLMRQNNSNYQLSHKIRFVNDLVLIEVCNLLRQRRWPRQPLTKCSFPTKKHI